MKLLTACLVVLATACGGVRVKWDTKACRDHQYRAMEVVRLMTHEMVDRRLPARPANTLGHETVEKMGHPTVYWVTEPQCPCPEEADDCTHYEENATIWWDGRCFAGLSFTWKEIYVAARPNIWDTALSHEMAHLYRLALLGDPDSDHEDRKWWDFYEKSVNNVIKRQVEGGV